MPDQKTEDLASVYGLIFCAETFLTLLGFMLGAKFFTHAFFPIELIPAAFCLDLRNLLQTLLYEAFNNFPASKFGHGQAPSIMRICSYILFKSFLTT